MRGKRPAEAFKLLSSGEVSGVFQVEGQGMRRVLTEMQPNAFEHIIATISLYRPGPMEYIPQFIRRMHGEEEVEYKHPALEPILAETYGIIVYQEQIIQILSQLAGYTPGEADLVRRAISKKKASEIEKHKQLFIAGCQKNGIPKEAAAAIYGDIEFFARYGFNKSHAADYAVITRADGLSQGALPGRVYGGAAAGRARQDREGHQLHQRMRGAWASTCCRRTSTTAAWTSRSRSARPTPSARPTATPHLAYDFPVPEGSAIRFGMAAVKNVGEGAGARRSSRRARKAAPSPAWRSSATGWTCARSTSGRWNA